MMRSWPILVRIGAWLALGLLAVQILAVLAAYAQRSRSTETGFRFPLPDRAAAIAELIETAPDRGTVLRAVNGDGLIVTLSDTPVSAYAAEPYRLPRVEEAVRSYLAALGGREAAVFFAVPEREEDGAEARITRAGLWSRHPMRLAIGLADGGTLLIETEGDLARRVFNWPLGLFSGIAGVAVGLIALWALGREMRPVRRLAAAAQALGEGRISDPVPETGAREVRGLIRAFNEMRGRIGELLENRALMLGAMSHDLRTYLTRLRLRVEAIEPEAERAKAVAEIERMAALVDDSLAVARLIGEAPGGERVDLAALLAEIAAEHPRASLNSAGPAPVTGSAAGFRRLFENLVGNALKFGTRCEIALARAGSVVTVTVADDGPGIPEAERAQAARPFWRGEAARTLGGAQGTGLGLAIARDIVARAGGQLRLEANAPRGLRAVVTLPAAAG